MNKIIEGMNFTDYQAHEAINASKLVKFAISPKHGRQAMDEKEEPPSKAMIMGSLMHRFILEPEKALENLVVKPMVESKNEDGETVMVEMKLSTTPGKAFKEAQKALGNTIISRQDKADILGMCKSVRENKAACELLEKGSAEVSMFADWEGKLTRKCRIDWLPPGNVLVDLKTCQDASLKGFQSQLAKLKYYLKAAYYIDIANANGHSKELFRYITVENTAPYVCEVYDLDVNAINEGRQEYQRLLTKLHECFEKDEWPGYNSEPVTVIRLPTWWRAA